MPAELVSAGAALFGALIGGGFTLAAQRVNIRHARTGEARAEQRRYVAALRLTVMDLDRSAKRLARMVADDPRGFAELPRGAWLEYRSLLAPRLEPAVLARIEAVYTEVVEWNEILWAAFAASPPDLFHRSDQHALCRDDAAEMLQAMHGPLLEMIVATASVLRVVRDAEAQRTERELLRPRTYP